MAARWTLNGARTALDGELYILQARPETVKSQAAGKAEHRYKLKGKGTRAGRRARHWPENRHRPGAGGAQHQRDGQGASLAIFW